MALQEEPSEQPQGGWFSRYSRERRDLSASVEDALAVSSAQQWDEEDDEVGIWRRSKQKGSLIPPRLSLQSKQMPTIHSGGFVESVAEMQPEVSVFDKTSGSTASTPPVNLWTRVAQRITRSLVAFGSTAYPEAFPVIPVSLREEPQFLSWQHEISLLPPPISQDGAYTDNTRFTSPSVQTFDALAGGFSAYPPSTGVSGQAVEPVTPGVRRQRPAGHITKIRLQTPSVPTTSEPTEQQTIDTPMPENMWIGSEMMYATPKNDMPDMATADLSEKASGTTSNHLPAIEMPVQGEEMVRAQLPVAEEAQHDAHKFWLMAFFSSGTIECGQSDISVTDAHTTSTSVVNVTLTSNPGPVVVQYISLQPHAGFTIHLTAPAATSTAFNYVILRGEP